MADLSFFRKCSAWLFHFLVRLFRPLVPLLIRFPLTWRVRDLMLSGPDCANWLKNYGPDRDADTNLPGETLAVLLVMGDASAKDRDDFLRQFAKQTVRPGVLVTVAGGERAVCDTALYDSLPETGYTLVAMAQCRPHPRLLERFGQCLLSAPETDLAYADEWRLTGKRVVSVFCKPAWDPLYFATTGYTGGVFAVKTSLLREVVRQEDETDLPFPDPPRLFALCLARARGAVTHLPVPLFGVPEARAALEEPSPPQPPRQENAPPCAPAALLPRAMRSEECPVSIIIPFRDRLDLLRPCVESLQSCTAWTSRECILVDNGSTDLAVKKYCRALEKSRFTVLECDEPFNFSRLVNFGAARASGDVLVLLNSDVEMRDPLWLQALVRFAVRKDIGCVGAKLLYPNGLVQHGGIFGGGGRSLLDEEFCLGHAHHGWPGNGAGYFRQLEVPRTVLAVTGAALAVRKAVFDSVGGFDERLAVAFNDVDFCLRVAASGLRTVWTPESVLVHHESATRGLDALSSEKRTRLVNEFTFLRNRWGNTILEDPWYNPNRSAEQMSALAEPPRRRSPRLLPASPVPAPRHAKERTLP